MINLSIIFGYRNRDVERVKRCLDSLKSQSVQCFEVIFVDYGSNDSYRFESEKLLKTYPFAHYIYTDTRGMPWNRSHALNTGIRLAKGNYTLFSDIDMIFSKNVIKLALSKINTSSSQLFSNVFLLPEDFNNWSSLNAKPSGFNINKKGKGGFHLISKKKIEDINGFDEYYCFWGFEDIDIHHRLEAIGLESSSLDLNTTPIYHQWHPMVYDTKDSYLPNNWFDFMYNYYETNRHNIRRNNKSWGKLLHEQNRPIIRYLNSKEGFNIRSLEGTQNTNKARIISDIIKNILGLSNNEILKITLTREQEKPKPMIGFINKILKKLHFDLYIIPKTQHLLYLETFQFIPTLNTSNAIWFIIKNTHLVSDYYITESEETITYLIASNQKY